MKINPSSALVALPVFRFFIPFKIVMACSTTATLYCTLAAVLVAAATAGLLSIPPHAVAPSAGSESAAAGLEQQLQAKLEDVAAGLTEGPQFASDILAQSSSATSNSSMGVQNKEPSDAKQRHFSPGTSVVVGIVAAFGLLQSTPRAAVFMSL